MQYRHKPYIIIQAEQFFPDKKPWPIGVEIKEWIAYPPKKQCVQYYVETTHGPVIIQPSDFIITGTKGQKYPVREDIFLEIYEEYVEPPSAEEYFRSVGLEDPEENYDDYILPKSREDIERG